MEQYNKLIQITIKSYIKHFGLRIENGFLYKGNIAIYTDSLEEENNVLSFLEGLSCVLDNKGLWGLEEWSIKIYVRYVKIMMILGIVNVFVMIVKKKYKMAGA